MKTQKEVRMKDGTVIPAGTEAKPNPAGTGTCLIQMARPEPYRVRYSSAFKAPGEKTLWKWSNDGVAKSVSGKKVEPDGTDEGGWPSWLLALGLI